MQKITAIFIIIVILFLVKSPITHAFEKNSFEINIPRKDKITPTTTPSVSPTVTAIPTRPIASSSSNIITTVKPTPATIAAASTTVSNQTTINKTAEGLTRNTNAKVTKISPTIAQSNSIIDYGENIIIPAAAIAAKENGINYYKNEKLPQETTNILLALSLFLMSLGIGLLKMPVLVNKYISMKEKKALSRPFTIPYFSL